MMDVVVRARPRVLVDPMMVSMAVRYCLEQVAYDPERVKWAAEVAATVADEVRAVADRLGDQRRIIMSSVADWLLDNLEERAIVKAEHREVTDPLRVVWVQLLADLAPLDDGDD